MIGKLKYEQVEALITQLQQSLDTINNITSSINNNELQDFTVSVDSYIKYLTGALEMYKEADKVLQPLKDSI